MKINHFIEVTNLKPDCTREHIEMLCRGAVENEYPAVCVLPEYVKLADKLLADSEVSVCTVVGFPLGASASEVKVTEARIACEEGADAVDMVINIAAFKNGEYDRVKADIDEVSKVCRKNNVDLKVIVETCLLSENEKIKICEIINETSADYIKTSTGYARSGATVEDVKLFRKYSTKKIKAAGGIGDYAFAGMLIAAGADRIGTSKARQIIAGARG